MHRRSFLTVILSSILTYENCFAKSSILSNSHRLSVDRDVLIQKSGNKVDREFLTSYDSFNSDFLFVKKGNDGVADLYVYHMGNETLRHQSSNHVYTRNGGVWVRLDYYFTLEDFGAIADGLTDCYEEVSLAFNSGLVIRATSPGVYLFRDTVRISAVHLDFKGFGKGETIFLLDHVKHGIVYDEPVSKSSKKCVSLSAFTIKRLNSKFYQSSAGPKGLYLANASPLRISDVEECYGIGYGIHIDYSKDIIIRRCHVHNHQYGMGGASGTDGIHIYRSEGILVENNVIHDVGDDAISTGSFDSNHIIKNAVIRDNYIYNTKSGIKVYSFARRVFINNNRVVNSREAGVYVTDDKNSIDGSTINDIVISANVFSSIGLSSKSDESAALRIRFWPNKNTKSLISHVTFKKNKILGCLTGVSVLTYDYDKKIKNLYIEDNFFKAVIGNNSMAVKDKKLSYFIRVVQCYGDFLVSRNDFYMDIPFLIKFDVGKITLSESEFLAKFIFVGNTVHSALKKNQLIDYFINFKYVTQYSLKGNVLANV